LGIIKHSQASKVADAKKLPPAEKVEVAQTLPSLDKLEVAATLPDSSKLRLVEDMPDIKSIVAKPTASDGVAAAVKDSTRPKVVSAPLAA
jgi:Mg/Co/Ni transporter MgtE